MAPPLVRAILAELHPRTGALFKTLLYYCLFSFLWIVFSDLILEMMNRSTGQSIFQLSVIKGITYVTVSALLIAVTITQAHEQRRREAALYLDKLHERALAMNRAYDATVEGWALAMELRDRETAGHCRRVVRMALRLGEWFGLPQEELARMRYGAILHDIGKMGVPDAVLLKPGPLTPSEREQIEQHVALGAKMLAHIDFLKDCLDIPLYHHERWDGAGYLTGLKGEEIPLTARIFAVVDVCDAMRSDRPYRRALPKEEVLRYLSEQSGRQFDPRVVEAVLALGLLEEEMEQAERQG